MRSPIIPRTDHEAFLCFAGCLLLGWFSFVVFVVFLFVFVLHFDGFVWSIDRDFQYIILYAALANKIMELAGKEARPGDKMLDLFAMLDPTKARVWEKICQRGFAGERQRVVEKLAVNGQAIFYEVSVNPIRKGEEIVG